MNVKHVHRLCRKEGLKVRRNRRKTRAIGVPENACHVRKAVRKNDVWTRAFVFDRMRSGPALKWLSIVDEFTRERLALKVDSGITSEDVIDTLAELFSMRGGASAIRSDNGPDFVAKAIQSWLAKVGVHTLYIQPGPLGRTVTRSVFTPGSGTSSSARSCSTTWPRPGN